MTSWLGGDSDAIVFFFFPGMLSGIKFVSKEDAERLVAEKRQAAEGKARADQARAEARRAADADASRRKHESGEVRAHRARLAP